jgi:hypothetical protein
VCRYSIHHGSDIKCVDVVVVLVVVVQKMVVLKRCAFTVVLKILANALPLLHAKK